MFCVIYIKGWSSKLFFFLGPRKLLIVDVDPLDKNLDSLHESIISKKENGSKKCIVDFLKITNLYNTVSTHQGGDGCLTLMYCTASVENTDGPRPLVPTPLPYFYFFHLCRALYWPSQNKYKYIDVIRS